MNAKQVIEFVNDYVKEKRSLFIRPSESFEVIEDDMLLFNKVFDLAQEIEPFDEWRDGTDRMFWINEENEWFYLYLAEHNKRRGMSDIHGMYEPFIRRIKQLNNLESVKAGKDKLILLGDYIDIGNNSFKVLKTIYELQKEVGADNMIVLMGNHDKL